MHKNLLATKILIKMGYFMSKKAFFIAILSNYFIFSSNLIASDYSEEVFEQYKKNRQIAYANITQMRGDFELKQKLQELEKKHQPSPSLIKSAISSKDRQSLFHKQGLAALANKQDDEIFNKISTYSALQCYDLAFIYRALGKEDLYNCYLDHYIKGAYAEHETKDETEKLKQATVLLLLNRRPEAESIFKATFGNSQAWYFDWNTGRDKVIKAASQLKEPELLAELALYAFKEKDVSAFGDLMSRAIDKNPLYVAHISSLNNIFVEGNSYPAQGLAFVMLAAANGDPRAKKQYLTLRKYFPNDQPDAILSSIFSSKEDDKEKKEKILEKLKNICLEELLEEEKKKHASIVSKLKEENKTTNWIRTHPENFAGIVGISAVGGVFLYNNFVPTAIFVVKVILDWILNR